MTSSKTDQEQAKTLSGAEQVMQNKCTKQVCKTKTGDKQKRWVEQNWIQNQSGRIEKKLLKWQSKLPFNVSMVTVNKFVQNLTVYVDVLWRNEGFEMWSYTSSPWMVVYITSFPTLLVDSCVGIKEQYIFSMTYH